MSRLDNYNKKTQESYERFIKSSESHTYLVSSYNSTSKKWEVIPRQEFEKRQLATFNQIKEYFQSDECNWVNMPSHHPDRKFVNHLRRYCETLKNYEVVSDDKTALKLIAENLVALDWKTVSETGRLIRTSWTEAELSYEYDGKLFRVMAYRLLQDVFIKPVREINAVNFSELEPPVNDSNRSQRPWVGSSSSSISSVGKRKCRVCGKPAFDDICFEHIK